jgi:hypothetical protein
MVRILSGILILAARFIAAPQSTPTIAALYPNAGATSGSVSALIRGINLANASSVTFSGTGVSAAILSGGTSTAIPIAISIAANASVGSRTITVTTPAGQAQFSSFFVTGPNDLVPAINPLTVMPPGLSRSVAPYYGSSFLLTVNGQSFLQDPQTQILANGTPLQTAFNSLNQLTALIPDSALSVLGVQDIAVRQKQNGASVNLVVSNTVPLRVVQRGDIDGNGTITMDDATALALNAGGLGGDAPLSLPVGDINLNGAFNIGDALTLGRFANGYVPNLNTPVITNVSPSPAVAGQLLTITGTGFAPTSEDMEVAFKVASGAVQRQQGVVFNPPQAGATQSTSLQVTVPALAVSGPIQIYRLDSPAGSQPFPLTVTGSSAPLFLTSVIPTGNGSVTLTGSGFNTDSVAFNAVSFNGVSAVTTRAQSETSIALTVPQGALCGGVTVQTTPDYIPMATSNTKPFVTGTCPLSLTGLWGATPGKVALLEGTGFNALSPSANDVELQPASGPPIPLPVVQAGSTELHVRIPDNASPGDVTVTISPVNKAKITSNAIRYQPSGPAITTISPNFGAKNSTVLVSIEGAGFDVNGTTVQISAGSGIVVDTITVSSSTLLTAAFHINPAAPLQTNSVTVSTTAGGTSAPSYFTVLGVPTITQIVPRDIPAYGDLGVTVRGTGLVGSTAMSPGTTLSIGSGAGVYAPIFKSPPTTMTASLGAYYLNTPVIGTRGVTASNSAGTSGSYDVYFNGLGSISPASGVQGSFLVTLTGCFPSGTTVSVLTGTSLYSPVANDAFVNVNYSGFSEPAFCPPDPSGSLPFSPAPAPLSPPPTVQATVTVTANAVPGDRAVVVRTAGIPNGVPFTIYVVPQLDSISIPVGAVGETVNNVCVHGYGFIPGKTHILVPGVNVTNEVVSDLSNMCATFAPTGAALGPQVVTVRTDRPDSSVSNPPVTFTILGAPTVTSFSPSVIGYDGGPMFITLNGSNFLPAYPPNAGTNVTVNGTGVTVTSVSTNSNFTVLRVALSISPGAITGGRTLTISTPAGLVPVNITLNGTPPAPTLTAINSASGPQDGTLTVTLTGTNFVTGGTALNVSGGSGVTASNFSLGFASSPISTQMTAFLSLSDPGTYSISVTTGGGTTATVPFTVTPNLFSSAAHYAVTHFAGPVGGPGAADDIGTNSRFISPQQVWSDGINLYIADSGNYVIRKIVIATGVTTTVAGYPRAQGAVDGVGAAARFAHPNGVWSDGTNLFVTDSDNHAIRKIVLATGAVSTLAGALGNPGLVDASGTDARFRRPMGICGDGTNLYVADTGNNAIRRVAIATGAVTVVAGSTAGTAGFLDNYGTDARFTSPQGVFCDGGIIYVADNNAIRKYDLGTNLVATIAGTLMAGSTDGAGGPAGVARFDSPVALWGDGTFLYVADHFTNTIRKVTISTGVTSTIAGLAYSSGSADGTGGLGGSARFWGPGGIWGVSGFLYVADTSNNTIRKVEIATQIVTTFAGSPGGSGFADGTGTAALFDSLRGLTGDKTNVYLLDPKIRKAAISTGTVTTIAGLNGTGSMDGAANVAQFNYPYGVWTDGANLYIADTNNSTIRKLVLATGFTSTFAGTAGSFDYLDATGTAARFRAPEAIWGDGVNLYVTDADNQRIRKIEIATGIVTTFAGSGSVGWLDGVGTAAQFNEPDGIWGDGAYLYVSDESNHVIRKIDMTTRQVTTLAGNPGVFGSSDGIGSAATFNFPANIWGDRTNLYVADPGNRSVRKIVIATGQVSTIAGGDNPGTEDGLDSNAAFGAPYGIWSNGSDMYVTDLQLPSIRKLTPATLLPPTVSSIAGTSGIRGITMAVTILGANFIPGSTSISAGGGISISNIKVTGPGTMIANFTIPANAATGPQNVTVTTSAGTSVPVAFTIN